MNIYTRFALAFALSLAISSGVQQWLLATYERGPNLEVFVPLGVCILLITALFSLLLSQWPRACGWVAAVMLAAMLAFGVVMNHVGVNSVSPGVGSTVVYGVAMVVVSYFLIPSAFAVPVHWLLLRGAPRAMAAGKPSE